MIQKYNGTAFNPTDPQTKQKDQNTHMCIHTHFCTFCEGQDFFRSHKLVKWIFYIGELENEKLKKPKNQRDPAIPFLGQYPWEIKTYVCIETSTHIYSSIIHKSQEAEITQMPIDR